MKDAETWELACEFAEVWDGLEQCRRWDEARNPLEPCPHGYYRDHNRACPPIGDPAAMLAMAEYIAHQFPVGFWIANGITLPLALAAAVCALKENQS